MGARARPIPVIAFQGDQDTTVPPVNADQLVSQWQLTNDLADNGSRDGSVSRTTLRSVTGRVPGGRSYTIRYYGDEHSNELVEYWLVHGMAHAWSGGCGCQAYADPSGPDETAAMYAFFSAHKLP
jgi:poly(3-hydroxybutyrate) depolymerase